MNHDNLTKPCSLCIFKEPLEFEFTMAFQPIVDTRDRSVHAYECLIRGKDGSSAASVLAQINDRNRYTFDQVCRVTAVEMAARLGVTCSLSINFLPNAVYEPAACIRATLAAARRHNFPIEKLIFEFNEGERPLDRKHLKRIVTEYRRQGFRTAIDDFGSGFSGLTLLADFQTDIIKLDIELVRDIDHDLVRQTIVRSVLALCRSLQIEVVAEGVERIGELTTLQSMGVYFFQGYLFARPGFEMLPTVHWPSEAGTAFCDAASPEDAPRHNETTHQNIERAPTRSRLRTRRIVGRGLRPRPPVVRARVRVNYLERNPIVGSPLCTFQSDDTRLTLAFAAYRMTE